VAPPNPTWIFHITAIDNLVAIGAAGEVLAKSELTRRSIAHASIAYEHIQERRSRKLVSVAPGGVLHEYVPFQFAPRSPMLFTIHNGNVPDCPYGQADIVHLVSTAQEIAARGLPFAFSNYHAVLDYAEFFNNLNQLDRVDWPRFFEDPQAGGYCKYWKNDSTPAHMLRKETRQAEFLIHRRLPLAAIKGIAVYDDQAATRVSAVLQQSGLVAPVKVLPAWYY
jgi:hypothetical protein